MGDGSNKKICIKYKKLLQNIWICNINVLPLYQQNERDMTQTRKYSVGASGSGWGVWDNETGSKIMGFGSRQIGRYKALRYMYELYGWNWERSKYVKENPWLATL